MSDMIEMGELLKPATPDPTAAPWPNSPPIEGRVYGFTCPSTGAEMVAMTRNTMLGFGTQLEGMRRSATALDAQCKELTNQYNDLADRHQALREKLRSDKLAELESDRPTGKQLKKLLKR